MIIVLCVTWKDKKNKAKKEKKPVTVVSTKTTVWNAMVTREEDDVFPVPTVIYDYNKSMNGCDSMDQSISYYGQFLRKTTKWWRCIFLWSLEICQVNAYILYCLTCPDDWKVSRISKNIWSLNLKPNLPPLLPLILLLEGLALADSAFQRDIKEINTWWLM